MVWLMNELAFRGRLRRAPGIRIQWEPAQNCQVLLHPEGVVRLNRAAGEILMLVDGRRDLHAIIAMLQRRFPDSETLPQEVCDFLEAAHAQHWITL